MPLFRWAGRFEALGVIVQNFVVLIDGLIVLLLRISNFAEIELRVGSKISVAIILDVILNSDRANRICR